jgi:hypothetical protein
VDRLDGGERMMEHTKTPWEREFAQDGEYTGPGDNPPGYVGEMYETNHVGWLDRETGEWTPVADFYRDTDCIKALQAVNSHEALVSACKGMIDVIDKIKPLPTGGIPLKKAYDALDAALALAGVK